MANRKTKTVPVVLWREIVRVYSQESGNLSDTVKQLKADGQKVSRSRLEKIVFDGLPGQNLPPVHEMWLDGVNRAVKNMRVEMTEQIMETMTLANAWKQLLAKKMILLDGDPSQVPDTIGQELRNVFTVEKGILEAMAHRGGGDDVESMPLHEAQKVNEEAAKALARQAGNSGDYGLSEVVKIKPGNRTLRSVK